MQNSLNKEGNIVEFSSSRAVAGTATDVMHGSAIPNKEFISQVAQLQAQQIKPVKLENIHVVKKDGTKEIFDPSKIVNAISKSATRVLVKLGDEEIQNICNFVENNIAKSGKTDIPIAEMHNFVEGALEALNPSVAQSYRNYRNYKQDFVHMLDKVYQESQRIMYIGDKENSNADSTLVSTKRSLIFNELNKELYKKFFLQ